MTAFSRTELMVSKLRVSKSDPNFTIFSWKTVMRNPCVNRSYGMNGAFSNEFRPFSSLWLNYS